MPVQKNRAFEEIAAQIKEQIVEGAWKEGEKIQGEIELAKLFQVSRGPMREAIKSLQMLGILEAHTGQGTFVSQNALQKINDGKLIEMINNESHYDEVLECRYVIEAQAAFVAAHVCTEEDIEFLLKNYHEMMAYTEIGDVKRYNQCGHEFHSYIVNMMHNDIISAFYASILPMALAERASFSKTHDKKIVLDAHHEHFELINALKLHDGNRAREIIESHLGWKIKDKNWKL